MAQFYFFTNPQKLGTQKPDQAFGPVLASDQAFVSGTDQYRITDLHSVDGASGGNVDAAPVIAVCDGLICVQPDDQGTYSIVLKPHYQPPFDFPYIKYFIYKGVRKDSLVEGNAIVDDEAILFTQRIHEAWVDVDPNSPNPISESASVLGLAYDASFEHPDDKTNIFTNTDPIDHFFYYPNKNFQLPLVRAGEKIGEFDNVDFGFEVVLERLGYEPKIELARIKKNYIVVDSFTRENPAPDDADYFMHWHEKEQCLNYIDPCAFYGSFCGSRVFYIVGEDKEKANSSQKIYDNLLISFVNKNKVYLDIRNDYNYSFNYFKDYGFAVKFADKDGSDEETVLSNQTLWPITTLDIAKIANTGVTKGKLFKTTLSLPLGNNSEPLVYLSRAFVKNLRRLKRKHKVLHPDKPDSGNALDFIDAVDIAFASIEVGGSDGFVSGYYKVNYYDQDRDGNDVESLAPSKEFYLNGLFRPLDMRQSIALRDDDFYFTIWHEEVLVDLGRYDGPAYIANIGFAVDQYYITLFAFPAYFIRGNFNTKLPNAYTTWTIKSKKTKDIVIEKIFAVFNNKQLKKQTLSFSNTNSTIDTVVVQKDPFLFYDNAFRSNENPEDYIFMLFKKQEYESIKSNLTIIPTLLQSCPVFFKKNSILSSVDNASVGYLKLLISANGYKTIGLSIIKQGIDINKEMYKNAHL